MEGYTIMANARKLRVSTFTSVGEARESLKRTGSGDIWSIPADGVVVRFVTEPDEWIGFYEYYDEDAKTFVPMAEGDRLPKGTRPSFRYLANVLWRSEGSREDKITALKLPSTVAKALFNRHEKFGTIVDRDYEITKSGEGFQTEYDVIPEEKSKLALSKYKSDMYDLVDLLIEEYERLNGGGGDDEESEEDEEETPKSKGKAKSSTRKSAAASRRGKAADEDEEEEEPEEEEDEDEDLSEMGEMADDGDEDAMVALTEAAEEAGLDPDDYDTWSDLAAVLSESEEEDEEPEEDEEDEESEEEEEVEIDEETLSAMSIKALKELADEYDIDIDGLRKKDDIIAAIIEAAEE